MDELRFDTLAKALATGPSRRTVLKGLVGGILGGLTGLAGRRATTAATPCTSGRQCPSFRCVDGFCCDRACTGQCEACNLAGSEGTCSTVTGAPVGNRAPCPGSDACAATCDGQHRSGCTFPGSDVRCGDATCADGWQTTYACGGNGTCTPTTTSCGFFVCNPAANACRTTCATDADCVGAAFCNAQGVCQGDRPLGESCASADQCQHGHCVDGVCCLEACEGVCEACNLPGFEGFCTQDADGATCAGGTCCDGDCVDIASDVDHCGGCDQACLRTPCADPVCQAGECGLIPVSGRACDDGDECTANDHCETGACVGTPVDCPACEVCSAGACVLGPNGDDCGIGGSCCAGVCCPALTECCPDDEGNGLCVDLTTKANCGACGTRCGQLEACRYPDGGCVACGTVFTTCDPADDRCCTTFANDLPFCVPAGAEHVCCGPSLNDNYFCKPLCGANNTDCGYCCSGYCASDGYCECTTAIGPASRCRLELDCCGENVCVDGHCAAP